MIVERVEVDRDAVLVPELVAVGDGGADRPRVLRVRDDGEINRILRIKNPRLGAVLGRTVIERLILMKPGEPRGLGPCWVGERPIDRGGRGQPRNGDGGSTSSIIGLTWRS